jgi:two-component system, NtrC family, response regulator AtoC
MRARRRILIIDDEEGVRSSLALLLADEGYDARAEGSADAGLRAAGESTYHVILCDVRMPGRSGLDVLPDLVRAQPQATVLMMSAHGDVDQALASVRLGAYDYLAKPFQTEELLLAIRKAEERERLRSENLRLRQELGREREGAAAFVAASPAMKQIYELVEQAAEYKTTVLVTGESGVGKEVISRMVHDLSTRRDAPFVAVNCGAIPETLIESELFGHAKGAFTGADQSKPGLFREADGGTLFLDEIGELPLPIQVKLLRVLQEEEVRSVGEAKSVSVDVRILAATSRDLEAEVEAGRFRADLFYRLNVFRLVVPPLRERREDIPVLADHLLARIAARMGKQVRPIGLEVSAALRAHAWPGNVRELENTLERAAILARTGEITLDHLPFARAAAGERAQASELDGLPEEDLPPGAEDLSIKRRTRILEDRLIRLALEKTAGNRTQAARILELSPRALQYKIKEYGIDLNPRGAAADPSPGEK